MGSSHASSLTRPVKSPRVPALAAAAAVAAGITADRGFGPPWLAWLMITSLVSVLWLLMFRGRCPRRSAILLAAGLAGLGGAWHHCRWSIAGEDDVSVHASETAHLVRLAGTLLATPEVRRRAGASPRGWAGAPRFRTIARLGCSRIDTGGGPRLVSGEIRLEVTGDWRTAQVGDELEVIGWLSRPRPPGNPGGFDFRLWLLARGVRCQLRVGNPGAIHHRPIRATALIGRCRDGVRRRLRAVLSRHIGRRARPVALALFLGDRTGLRPVDREAFVNSGTMHLLAISGLHVGLLAAMLWAGCRIANLGPAATLAVLSIGVGGYAMLVEARPPVIRATILVLVTVAGRPWFRRSGGTNALSVAALLVMARNPTDLFDAGAQLSFIAVATILVVGRVSLARPSESPVLASRFRRALGPACRWLVVAWLVSGTIWLVTAPLIAARFGLLAPAGLVINVLLLPVVAVALWCGFAMLAVGLLAPPLAVPFGVATDRLLDGLLAVVDAASTLRLGHLDVPAPPGWWLVGWYGLLAVVVRWPAVRAQPWRAAAIVVGWLAGGLAVGLPGVAPAKQGLTRCTVLSVGHGCAVVIETPGGRTLVFDAGRLPDGKPAARAIRTHLRQRGRHRIDALVISHADRDHYNAVPRLLDRVPVGTLLIADSFLDRRQPMTWAICEQAAARDVPVKLVRSGDRLLVEAGVSIHVLHPPADWRDRDDNANSIVLQVEVAGRRVLLTGDLEGRGTERILALPPRTIDVLLSPHHGSLPANPPQLGRWAQPGVVIVSGGRETTAADLAARYPPDCRIFSTRRHGAVSIEIARDGSIDVRCHRVTE